MRSNKKGTYDSKKRKRYKVSDLVDLWLRGYKNTVRNSTYASTLGIINNHILPDLGTYYLDQLQSAKCIEVVNGWAEIAPKSVKKFMIYANKILDKGVEWQMLQQNPMKYVDCPKIKKNKLDFTDFYSKEELEKFLEEAKKSQPYKIFAFFRLLAYAGIRRGEALALTWGDIDFKTNILSINKTVAQGEKNKLMIDNPKSESGFRDIPLDSQTMAILEEWRKKQREEMFKLGYNTDHQEQLVFPNESNGLYQPSRVAEWDRK
ncbi:site-specific recombinase, phage integrase family [Lactobacillus gasseri 224-1]|uniref:Site-specific recombinase, phage integrase family n=1 Tax=Lactobacillus gasseri 224-1 TaxID=679196 RepID=D1YL98_LACGS|nr:site-specific recombinase, phage integrase family [Lactobacillus gasseri 224-1]